jgi:hypothetical protein
MPGDCCLCKIVGLLNDLCSQAHPALTVVIGPIREQRIVSEEVRSMSLIITDTQQVELSISPVDRRGNPTRLDGSPVWDSTDNSIVKVVPQPGEPLRAIASAVGKLGRSQVNVRADAQRGDGVREIFAVVDIEVVAGDAAVFDIQSGTITEQDAGTTTTTVTDAGTTTPAPDVTAPVTDAGTTTPAPDVTAPATDVGTTTPAPDVTAPVTDAGTTTPAPDVTAPVTDVTTPATDVGVTTPAPDVGTTPATDVTTPATDVGATGDTTPPPTLRRGR